MPISTQTIIRAVVNRLEYNGSDYAGSYGEPGYHSEGGVILGDFWCRCDKVEGLHDIAVHYPLTFARLDEDGVDLQWHDEWIVDWENGGKAYRIQPDSYSWQPSLIIDDNGGFLTPDDPIDRWLEWAVNESTRVIPHNVFSISDLETVGFESYNGTYANGWYDGQNDDPAAISERIRRDLGDDVEIVFYLNGVGQFDVHFTAWVRGGEDQEVHDADQCCECGEDDHTCQECPVFDGPE